MPLLLCSASKANEDPTYGVPLRLSISLIAEHEVTATVSAAEALLKLFSAISDCHVHGFGIADRLRISIVQSAGHVVVGRIREELGDLAVLAGDASHAAIVTCVLSELDADLVRGWIVAFTREIVAGRWCDDVLSITRCIECLRWWYQSCGFRRPE